MVLLLEVNFDGAFGGERDFFLGVEMKFFDFDVPHLRIQGGDSDEDEDGNCSRLEFPIFLVFLGGGLLGCFALRDDILIGTRMKKTSIEQETREMDEKIKQGRIPKTCYGVTNPHELRRNLLKARVTYDAVMLHVFPMTLTGAAKRYCPPSKTAKQLEEILNLKKEGDESLYQAWERYNDLLYKFLTHDINSQQKVNIFNNGLGTMNRQLLDAQGPIPGMTPARALTAIQTLADHSQNWHDGSSSRNTSSSSNSKGIAAIVSKLYGLGRDMKKMKENVHAIQVGCQDCFSEDEKQETRKEEEASKVVATINITPEVKLASQEEVSFSLVPSEGMGKLELINMVIEMVDNTRCVPKGIVKNLLIKIDKFIFPMDFDILDMVEDFMMPIILGRILLATTHAKVDIFNKSIYLEVGNEKVIFKMRHSFTTTSVKLVHAIKSEVCPEDNDLMNIDPNLFLYESEAITQKKENGRKYWASCDPYGDVCNGGDLHNEEKKRYWEITNDGE
ncbi:zinc knuckle CX2CX4HX4C containing protein [Tanacetum coccineum]